MPDFDIDEADFGADPFEDMPEDFDPDDYDNDRLEDGDTAWLDSYIEDRPIGIGEGRDFDF